jgi:histidyl-tRNA synthetase
VSEKGKFRAVKGVRDILPPDSALWNRVEGKAREIFGRYGYREIRLPIFEHTELFARSIGEDTEVVSKEMFTFLDPFWDWDAWNRIEELTTGLARSATEANLQQVSTVQLEAAFQPLMALKRSEKLTLRPEATASACRAYIEHGMQTLPGNVKLYYMGPMFRRERPQKGRFRQFYQIGAEVLGQSDAPGIDAELIEMLMVFFDAAGLKGAQLFVNSIGDKNCRPKYVEALREALREVKEQLGPDSQRRIETNPLRVLDSKIEAEQAVIEKLPRIADHLCEECKEHFAKLRQELDLRGVAYHINWRLVRGLDYYMRTTFEIIAPGLGSQNAVCGGGRYDGLVELLGGPPVKGVGFAIGTDRVILSVQEGAQGTAAPGVVDVFVAWMGQRSYPTAVRVARTLRDAGLAVELPAEQLKFKKSLGLADKLGARYALIIGDDEVASGKLTLKRLADGEQAKIGEGSLVAHLESELKTAR